LDIELSKVEGRAGYTCTSSYTWKLSEKEKKHYDILMLASLDKPATAISALEFPKGFRSDMNQVWGEIREARLNCALSKRILGTWDKRLTPL
jgi:hypothetical protein